MIEFNEEKHVERNDIPPILFAAGGIEQGTFSLLPLKKGKSSIPPRGFEADGWTHLKEGAQHIEIELPVEGLVPKRCFAWRKGPPVRLDFPAPKPHHLTHRHADKSNT